MRILIFSTAYYPYVGGAEVAVKAITDRLPDYHFDLITARLADNLPRQERIGNVTVYRVGLGYSWDKFLLPLLGCFLAWRLNRKNNYTYIWSIMASQAGIAASFFKLIFRHIDLILTVQEGDEEEHLKRYVYGNEFLFRNLILPLHRLVFKKADYITAISQDLKTRTIRSGAKCEIAVIPNGVDIAKYNQAVAMGGIKQSGDKIIITTSRLVAKNGVDDLIGSLSFLDENIKLWILGIGPDEIKLKNLAKELGVEKRITFFGFVSGDLIPSYLKSADVFIRPSLSEGLGNSFLEAMAAEVSVIGTRVGGIPDFLKENVTGWFCEVKNPMSIAAKVKYIFDDNNRDVISVVKENAHRLVQENYNWDTIAIDMDKIFGQIQAKKDNRIRLVIATGTFPPEVSGQATYVSKFFDQLKFRQDVNPHIVTYGDFKNSLDVTVIRRSWRRHLDYFLAIKKAMKAGLPRRSPQAQAGGIIYAQDLFSSGLPAALAKGRGNKLYVRLGGDFLWEKMVNSGRASIPFSSYYMAVKTWPEMIYIYLFKFILWRCDKIIFNNEWQKDIYQKFYHIPADKIVVVTNYKLGSFGLLQNDITRNDEIIFAGRFISLKNLRRLIGAFKQIVTDKKLILIGEGPLREELEFLVKDEPRIIIESRLSREELWDRIAKCYAFIVPSLSEMNPNVAREAFNLRKPVILTKEVGFSVEAKEYFRLIDPLSVDDIRSGIEFFLDEKNYLEHQEKIKDVYFYDDKEESVNKFLAL